MAWNDKVYGGGAIKANAAKVKQLDLDEIYKWHNMNQVVRCGLRDYECKVEYLVRHGEVCSAHVTCLQSPMADFDITSQLTAPVLAEVMDQAREHYGSQR